ncbi:hypothetical protein Bbelb_290670 [Branchiostoma belcheri]|nr:hypothetical protein Bbelb_290670 [Branchiostoma belcheri]
MGLGGDRRLLNFLNPESSKVDTFLMLQCVAVYGKTVQKRAIVVLGTDAPLLMQEFMAGRQTDSPAEGFPKKVHSAINDKTKHVRHVVKRRKEEMKREDEKMRKEQTKMAE